MFSADIYPSSFTNVRFWSKIEFLNVAKCRWGSRAAVSSAMGSWQSRGGGSGVKPGSLVIKEICACAPIAHANL